MYPQRLAFSICFYFLIFSSLCFAQANYHVGHIGSEDGLASQLCTHVIQDDLGNLWFSSFRDIQKYNGYSVNIIPANEITGEQNQGITDLFKDKNGNVWMNQAHKVTHEEENIWNTHYKGCHFKIVNPSNDSVLGIDKYLGLFDEESIIKVFPRDDLIYFVSKDKSIYTLSDTLRKHITVTNPFDVMTIMQNGSIVEFQDSLVVISSLEGESLSIINAFSIETSGTFITSKSGKLFLLDERNNTIIIQEYHNGNFQYLGSFDRDWFKNLNLMYTQLDLHGDQYMALDGKLYVKDDYGEFQEEELLNTKLVNEFYIGETGLGYAATNLGVYVLNKKNKHFHKFESNELTQNSVRAIYMDEHILAYKTHNHEVISSESEYYDLSFLDSEDLGYMAFMHYKDPLNKHHLWSSGYLPKRIRRIDFLNQEVKYYNGIVNPSQNFQSNVNAIIRSSITSHLYTCTSNGVFKLSDDHQIFEQINLGHDTYDILEANHIIEKDNKLWIATSKGVLIYDELNDKTAVKQFYQHPNPSVIQFIHPDHKNKDIVWLGTQRRGLIRWNSQSDSVTIFNTEHGLSNNDVHAIIEDNSDRLWISTNSNLNCFDKQLNKNYIYTQQDGLSHSEFNKFSYFYDTIKNHIYFGGLNGYNYFNPDSISTSNHNNKIKVRILELTKTKNDGSVETLSQESLIDNAFTITQEDIAIQISLSTNHLFDNEKTKYSYRIPGLFDEWETQTSNELKISRLPYGRYKLELASDINEPELSSNVLVLDVFVIQPFTKTWTFLILCIFGFLTLTWFVVMRYNKSIVDRNQKLEKTVATRTQELTKSNAIKNKIFTILAHDLRNPISSLTDLTDKIKFLSKHGRLDELNTLTDQTKSRINALNDNLNNILFWSLHENDTLKLYPQKLSLLHEINKILDIYYGQIEEKEIKTKIALEDIDQVYLDITLLQTILRNFIANAIKFSHKNGIISFSKAYDTEEYIELKIEDQGIGLANSNRLEENIRNKVIRKKGQGSGIGLLISEELSARAGIKLRVESEIGKGTSIFILMPK